MSQLGLFNPDGKREIRVEYKGSSAVVDVKQKACECGKDNCIHKYVAVALYEGQMVFESTSAMHKEIRRGDVEKALRWGFWVDRNRGTGKLRQYLRNICFEETRNEALHVALRKERNWVSMIRLLCGSTKRWQIPSRFGADWRILDSYWRMKKSKKFEDVLEAAKTCTDLDWLYDMVNFVQVFRRDYGLQKGVALALADRTGVAGIAATNYNGMTFMVEKIAGILDESATRIQPLNASVEDSFGLVIPPFEDYVFDAHTRQGRARIGKVLSKIGPNQPQPDGIDLRWSGNQVGVVWRALASKQNDHQSIQNTAWESVQFDDELWNHAVKTDRDLGAPI